MRRRVRAGVVAVCVLAATLVASASPAAAPPTSTAIPEPVWLVELDERPAPDAHCAALVVCRRAVTVDRQGGAITTGDGYVQEFSPAGALEWEDRFDGFGIGVAAAGDRIHVADFGGQIRSYSPSRRLAWTDEVMAVNTAGERASLSLSGIAVAGDGTVYVTGHTRGVLPGQFNFPGTDGFVRAYSPTGEVLWTDQFGIGTLYTTAITVGPLGTVYVTGRTEGKIPGQANLGEWDGFVRAYSAGGEVRWSDQIGSAGWDWATGVAAGPGDTAYVAGAAGQPLPGETDALGYLRAYGATGAVLWTATGIPWEGTGAGVTVDSVGTVHIAGDVVVEEEVCEPHCRPPVHDAYLAAYTAAGQVLWSRRFGSDVNDQILGISARGQAELTITAVLGGAFRGAPDPESVLYLGRLAPPTCRGVAATIVAPPSGGVLLGTPGADVMVGGIGDDTIHGLNGDDVICGGVGNDMVFAGAGDDTVLGQRGHDKMRGGAGDDVAAGGAGNDVVVGNGGADHLRAGQGADRLNGGFGADVLGGGDGPDRMVGSNGDDDLDGGRGDDKIIGGADDDTLRGSLGDDVLQGRAGDDLLDGGHGRDRCNGGLGLDTLTNCEVLAP